jgi:hypothetical protein
VRGYSFYLWECSGISLRIRQICDGHHRQVLNKLLWVQGDAEAKGASMMTKGIIAVAAAFLFALTVGILTAESGNDKASNPTIRTLALQY